MDPTSIHGLQHLMLSGMFFLGGITFVIGIIILILGAWGSDTRNLISQSSRLAQKGLADEISGLVGNASTLLSTLNDMIRTRNGIGIIFIITGAVMMIIPYWFTLLLLK